MDEATYLAMTKQIEALEARIARLEKKAIFPAPGGVTTEDLSKAYPQMMNKTEAADALGVTRATIYAMLSDGRLKQNAMGKVITESVVEMLQPGMPNKSGYKREKALRMSADHQN